MYNRCVDLISKYGKKLLLGSSVMIPLAAVVTSSTVIAADISHSEPPHYHWQYHKWSHSHDVASVRRGYQVYKEVCASCHPMKFVRYRQMVGTIFSEKQAKKEASQIMVEDGPDDQGEMFLRPGKLRDTLPSPYKNDRAAAAANNGAIPPDLSLITIAREHENDYIFSLLLGYQEEVPPGFELGKGQYFNPFFEGGALAMPPPLQDGAVEYPDGTVATVSQMAKDVCEFFNWSAWRNMDRQKQLGLFTMGYIAMATPFLYYCKRYHLASMATQKITYKLKRPSF